MTNFFALACSKVMSFTKILSFCALPLETSKYRYIGRVVTKLKELKIIGSRVLTTRHRCLS